ncbi:MAG: SPOR domain-containing protein [Hyphomonas sp.]
MSRREMADQEHPFEDDYRGFDVREDETARGPLILAIAAGVLLIFVGVIWNTYRQGVRPPAEALPSVLADGAPFKQLPADRGGQLIPHREIQFYDAMDSTSREPGEAALAGGDAELIEAGSPRDLRPAPLDSPGAAETVAEPPPVHTVRDVPPAPTPAPAQEPPMLGVTLRAPEPIEPLGSKARFKFTESGPFLVQLAALRTEEAAETAWRRVTSSAPELYHGASKRIQRADLGSEGVFYRLRVGAFADRAEAAAFCEAVKEAGAACIVVTG